MACVAVLVVSDHSGGMPERQQLVQEALAALDRGELEPFKELLAPAAQWVAIPQGEDVAEAPKR